MTPQQELWDWRRRVAESYAAVRARADPEAAWRGWRADRDALFATHPQSPQPGKGDLPFFPYDPRLRMVVPLRPAAGDGFDVPAGADGTVRLQPFARTGGLAGTLGGELTLYWIAGYGGGAFLPFADATSGQESYGGGRYLLDTIKGADLGWVGEAAVLDFNFAYNPSCAYADRWACPLAPPGNRLKRPVRAGERMPTG